MQVFKRILTVLIIGSLLIATGICCTYAIDTSSTQEEPTSDVPEADKVSKTNIKNDPRFPEIEEQYNLLLEARESERSIVEELRIAIIENMELNALFLTSGLSDSENSTEFKSKINSLKNVIDEIKGLMEQKKSLQEQARKLQPTSLTPVPPDKMAKIIQKMDELKVLIDDLGEQIAEREGQLQALMSDAMQSYADLVSENKDNGVQSSENLQKLHDDTTVLKDEIRGIQISEEEQWQIFKGAVESGDLETALEAISLKNQYRNMILEHLKSILKLENQITDELKSLTENIPG